MATLVTEDFGSIDYVECYDGPRSPAEMLGVRQSTVQRTFLVAWDDRLKFAAALLGYPQIATYMGGATYVKRVLPDHYSVLEELNPTAHTGESLYATRVMRGEGIGAESTSYATSAGGPVSRYTKCKLEVEYSHLPFEILGDTLVVSDNLSAPDEAQLLRFVEKQVNPGADYQRLPPHGFKHIKADGSEGEVVPGSPGKLVPNSDLSLTWHQVPQEGIGLPLLNAAKTAITAALGRVNKYTFAGCEPGTLLLTAANIRRYRHFFGYWLCNVTYGFKYLDAGEARDGERAGHNYLFAAWPSLMDGVGHYEVSADGNNITIVAGPSSWGGNENSLGVANKNLYDWADFATLFRPGGEGVE